MWVAQGREMAHLGRHAIVIGASMGGLLAGRALADYYDEVTLIDRDALPLTYEPRKGVPQGRHTHGLLARGRAVLEELFPGFTAEMVADGAVSDPTFDISIALSGSRKFILLNISEERTLIGSSCAPHIQRKEKGFRRALHCRRSR
jgi:2-polyprenyl-6-methoxyphenol hydroxylase-like FAD-dependent oxidoreductase